MAEYETEEQQVEAIKRWWKENGLAISIGAGLGISTLFGWYGWNNHQEKLATEASDIFISLQEAVRRNDIVALEEKARTLRDEYASTPYAPLAVLHQVKVQHEKDDNAASEESLRWVLNNAKQENVQAVARLRLARLLLAENKIDEAEAMMSKAMPEAYASLMNEVRGDIFFAKGEIEQARQAYDQAMQATGGENVEFLELKRSDLGG